MGKTRKCKQDKLGTAALNLCKVAKSTDGVHSAKFYWPNPNMVAFVVEAETGSWGIGAEPTGEAMKAFFDLGDAASCVMDETWVDASLGQKGLIEQVIEILLAERVGFEPTNEFPRCWFSRPVLSTAQPPLP